MSYPFNYIKAAGFLFFLLLFVLTIVPLQMIVLALRLPGPDALPRLFFRYLCFFIGIRVHRRGTMVTRGPALLVPNHVSYLDMPVLGSSGRLSFVSTTEVRGWTFFGFMSTLQRSVYIDRTKRTQAGAAKRMIQDRLAMGDILVLFAEGTSTLGTRMIPFKSSLLGVVEPDKDAPAERRFETLIQPVSVAYTRLHGLPMGRRDRPLFAWYGGMDLLPHIWQMLKAGPIDVEVTYHEPVPASRFASRKELARYCERVVSQGLATTLAGHDRPGRRRKARAEPQPAGEVGEPLAAAQ